MWKGEARGGEGRRRSRSRAAENIIHHAMTRGEDPDALIHAEVDDASPSKSIAVTARETRPAL